MCVLAVGKGKPFLIVKVKYYVMCIYLLTFYIYLSSHPLYFFTRCPLEKPPAKHRCGSNYNLSQKGTPALDSLAVVQGRAGTQLRLSVLILEIVVVHFQSGG